MTRFHRLYRNDNPSKIHASFIVDEYGTFVHYDEFCKMIETYKSPKFVNTNGQRNLSHNEEGKKLENRWFDPEYDWDDTEGYSFSSREFS